MSGSLTATLLADLGYLAPWDFSPTVVLVCAATAALYLRGLLVRARDGQRNGFWRPFSFLLGLLLIYGALQTYMDYLSQHMFWVHRLQHLLLHHFGPFLMIIAAPGPVLRQGLPSGWWWRAQAGRAGGRAPAYPLVAGAIAVLRGALRMLQQPFLAGFLFVGLVYFWLIPPIHFTAMLDVNRYRLMNWSMAVDGVLFWWVMLTPRSQQGGTAARYSYRLVVLVASGFLQLFLGAFIVMYPHVLFNVYDICGRAWATSPLTDQQIGGCLTWIPPAMMSLAGVLVVIHHMLHDPEPQRRSRRVQRAVPVAPAAPARFPGAAVTRGQLP